MGLTFDISIPVLTVLAQGILSFFSPCVLPLLPVYFGFLSGGLSVETGKGRRVRTLVNTVCFVLGIGFAFLLLALGMTAFGSFFRTRQAVFAAVGGVLVILLGIYQTGLTGASTFLSRELRLPFRLDRVAASPLTALVLGFVFSFSWTPCVGPALSSVLLMAASSPSRSLGFVLIGVYTLGFAVPFLMTGIFTTSLLRLFREHRSAVRLTEKAGGILLILMGLFMLTGGLNRVSANLAETANLSTQEANTLSDSEQNAVPYETEGGQEELPDEDVQDDTIPAIEFELTDQYGHVHRLSDYRGKVVFLNFWATWCPPCRAEMPDIQNVYEETQAGWDDVVIIGVASPNQGSEQDEAGIRAFLAENNYTYPVVMDATGSLFQAYSISAIPTTFMIDRDGNIFGYVSGSMTEDVMRNIIEQTLNAGA